jgi:hypothetical protein
MTEPLVLVRLIVLQVRAAVINGNGDDKSMMMKLIIATRIIMTLVGI